jgi:hypothetical protein
VFQTMITLPKDDFRLPLDLVFVGAVATATIGLFFGAAFLLLAPPHLAAPPADSVSAVQTLAPHEVPPPGQDATARGSPLTPFADNVAAIRTVAAPANRESAALPATALETALVPPAKITHRKKVWVSRRRDQGTRRHWTGLWRPHASAGPNPGGGFYGPPNINVGRINPLAWW